MRIIKQQQRKRKLILLSRRLFVLIIILLFFIICCSTIIVNAELILTRSQTIGLLQQDSIPTTSTIISISFLQNGQLVVVVPYYNINGNNEIQIWDTKTHDTVQLETIIPMNNTTIHILQYNPQQTLVATASNDNNEIRIWNVSSTNTWQLIKRFTTFNIPIHNLIWHPNNDGKYLAVTGNNNTYYSIWDTITWTPIIIIEEQNDSSITTNDPNNNNDITTTITTSSTVMSSTPLLIIPPRSSIALEAQEEEEVEQHYRQQYFIWSLPDGDYYIVNDKLYNFTRGNNTYIRDIEICSTNICTSSSTIIPPQWSPNGKYIVYAYKNTIEILYGHITSNDDDDDDNKEERIGQLYRRLRPMGDNNPNFIITALSWNYETDILAVGCTDRILFYDIYWNYYILKMNEPVISLTWKTNSIDQQNNNNNNNNNNPFTILQLAVGTETGIEILDFYYDSTTYPPSIAPSTSTSNNSNNNNTNNNIMDHGNSNNIPTQSPTLTTKTPSITTESPIEIDNNNNDNNNNDDPSSVVTDTKDIENDDDDDDDNENKLITTLALILVPIALFIAITILYIRTRMIRSGTNTSRRRRGGR